MLRYKAPKKKKFLTKRDVRNALDFFVAIEPKPHASSIKAYRAAMLPYKDQIGEATRTIRRFAEQYDPPEIEQMRRDYYSFTNSSRYLTSPEVSSVVIASLREAWEGVGPWRN